MDPFLTSNSPWSSRECFRGDAASEESKIKVILKRHFSGPYMETESEAVLTGERRGRGDRWSYVSYGFRGVAGCVSMKIAD